MVAPSGGEKDTSPPEIIRWQIENKKSGLVLSFEFDEYIQFANWQENFFISPPLLNGNIKRKIHEKTLMININDSIQKNKRYHVNLTNCIKDFNEGNLSSKLEHVFSINESTDTFSLKGVVKDAYNAKVLNGVWVLIFKENINDSLIFYSQPNYISKTNSLGEFCFPNLSYEKYKLFALSGNDLFYHAEEKIGFLNSLITPTYDSLITLTLFDPNIIPVQSKDSLFLDTLNLMSENTGIISINSKISAPAIFELIKNDLVIKSFYFKKPPFILKNIPPDTYKLKYIYDKNYDKEWTTGSWKKQKQPEKIKIYNNVVVRPNWNLELDWNFNE